MSNNLIQNLNCSDVYRTYTLLLTADKDSLETNTTLKQLAGFVGEELDNYKKSKSTLSFNDKLRATGEVVIRDIDSKQKDRHWTMYRFNQVEPGNYRRIGREFYDTYHFIIRKAFRIIFIVQIILPFLLAYIITVSAVCISGQPKVSSEIFFYVIYKPAIQLWYPVKIVRLSIITQQTE